MNKEKNKQMIKLWVAISSIVIIAIIVITIMIKYEVEGDKNMPFNLSKIVIVSTAEGSETKGKNKWNFDIFQNNDVYFYIDKNEKYNGKEKNISSVKIENIEITKAPQKGKIEAYMPNSLEGRLFTYTKEYIVDNKLEYKGAQKSNPKTLEIGSQGGSAIISFSNIGLGQCNSDDKEIIHNGTLLNRINVKDEEIFFSVLFDFIIDVDECKYKANILLDLPCGEITKDGTKNIEKTDMSDIIFKRINK